MSWVIDTCVVLDVLEPDPEFGLSSVRLLEQRWSDGLSVCPVTWVELAPAFGGDLAVQRQFFLEAGIDDRDGWTVADVLIGAFAVNRRGLIPRNAGDFRGHFPTLEIMEP